MRPNANPSVDVTVLGGGPAGAATAMALSRLGYSVVVIEISTYNNLRIGEMLPPGVRPLLVSLGVWDQFLAQKHSPSFGVRSAWGQTELVEQNFIFDPHGSGWHLNRARFDLMLAQATMQAGVTIWRDARLTGTTDRGEDGWDVTVACADTQQVFRTRFMVDATGRAAALARRQGARRLVYDHLIGVAGFFPTSSSSSMAIGYTLIEAIEGGWWYAAALPDGCTVAVLMTDADVYAKGSRASARYWQDQLERSTHTQSFLEASTPPAVFRIATANSSRLDCIARRNLLAVGDAAAAFDPLSSQGVFNALKSGLRAAEAIHDTFAGRSDALEECDRAVREDYKRYLHSRESHYSKEKRWPHSGFWRRRHLPGTYDLAPDPSLGRNR